MRTCLQLIEEIESEYKIRLSSQAKAAQSKTGTSGGAAEGGTSGKKIHESWPGAVCSVLMDRHEEILKKVYPDQDSPEYQYALELWQDFIYWSREVSKGCDDTDSESRRTHGHRLRLIAERFACRVSKPRPLLLPILIYTQHEC